MKLQTITALYMATAALAFQSSTPTNLLQLRTLQSPLENPALSSTMAIPTSHYFPQQIQSKSTPNENGQNLLLLSDKMAAASSKKVPAGDIPSQMISSVIALLAFKVVPAQLLVQGTIAILGGPYQRALLQFGKIPTLLTLSFATLVPIALGIGLQMLPHFVTLAGADATKAQKAVEKNLRKTKKMMPVAKKFSVLLAITSFIAMMRTGDIATVPQNFNIVKYGIRRVSLFVVADFLFHAIHRLAHMQKSKNPIIRKLVKEHRTHHWENGNGVLPLNILHQDWVEGLEIILTALLVIFPFNGAHPLVISPLWVFVWGFDAAAAHSTTTPFADGGFHVKHHVHQQGNFGLGIIADKIWGTDIGRRN